MNKHKGLSHILIRHIYPAILILLLSGCAGISRTVKSENSAVPETYYGPTDTINIAQLKWRNYFSDPNLISLIDSALVRNQELNIILQEIEISKNEVRSRKGEYRPFLGVYGGGGIEKEGRYTRFGAVDDQLEIKPGKKFPEPFGDIILGVYSSWEIDVWKKLRNARQSAVMRYLASTEGRNFMVCHVIAEIADSYYELLALDNLLDIVDQNIAVQQDALNVVRQQKDAAKVSQLAVNRFEAQLLHTQNLRFEIRQGIVETENHISFLTGRFPRSIPRSAASFDEIEMGPLQSGIPSQLLSNRPDIRQAEWELAASKLDVKVARANFYPSLSITAHTGFQAFNPAHLINPESILYNLAGDLMAPLINRNAIKAAYNSASARQIQAVYHYEQTILNAYVDVLNQLSMLDNYSKSLQMKSAEVDLLRQSVNIAGSLFNSARADYMEVLLTQREALDSKMELIEIKRKQLHARVNLYRALGGGWN